jgi:hypothetical protein
MIGYAVLVWYAPQQRGTGTLWKQLQEVQRMGARNILSASRTVSLRVLGAETNLLSVDAQLDKKMAAYLSTQYRRCLIHLDKTEGKTLYS